MLYSSTRHTLYTILQDTTPQMVHELHITHYAWKHLYDPLYVDGVSKIRAWVQLNPRGRQEDLRWTIAVGPHYL